MATTKLMTADDLDELDDDKKYELIDGELYEVAPASGEHGGVAFNLVSEVLRTPGVRALIKGYIADAPFLLARDPDDVVVPDAAFVLRERLPIRDERVKRIEIPPDIAVEVLSPSDRPSFVTLKVMRYLRAGTQLVWLIDPVARTVTVFGADQDSYVLSDADTLGGGNVIPVLSILVSKLFED